MQLILGFSGKPRKSVIEGIVPLFSVEYNNLEIDARMRRVQAEYESQNDFKIPTEEAKKDVDVNTEKREIVLTEWGIDIFNFFDVEPLKPFVKPKIRSPRDRLVHIPTIRSSKRQKFKVPARYGSWLNTLACSHPTLLQAAHQDSTIMFQQSGVVIKNIRTSYKHRIKRGQDAFHHYRGLSFRGRGQL